MFSSEFTLFLERYFVIPLIGLAIAHGWVPQGSSAFWVTILDNIFGGLFVIIAYLATHRVVTGKTVSTTTTQSTLWSKIKGFMFNSSTQSTTTTPTGITGTTPVAS